MSRGKASGIVLTNKDASIVLGMVVRDDREHDIAAWFGVNQGRIAEVKAGSHGSIAAAQAQDLPPKGPPGPKGRRLRSAVGKALDLLAAKGDAALAEVTGILQDARKRCDADEVQLGHFGCAGGSASRIVGIALKLLATRRHPHQS